MPRLKIGDRATQVTSAKLFADYFVPVLGSDVPIPKFCPIPKKITDPIPILCNRLPAYST